MFKKILQAIGNFLSGAAKSVINALTKGNEIANAVKNTIDSPLLDIVTHITPTGIDDRVLMYLRKYLPIWIATMGWAEKKLSDFDETTLPHVMNAINAEASKLIADFNSVDLTRQQAIASAQVVYDAKVVNV